MQYRRDFGHLNNFWYNHVFLNIIFDFVYGMSSNIKLRFIVFFFFAKCYFYSQINSFFILLNVYKYKFILKSINFHFISIKSKNKQTSMLSTAEYPSVEQGLMGVMIPSTCLRVAFYFVLRKCLRGAKCL